jgi:hypothetical protein
MSFAKKNDNSKPFHNGTYYAGKTLEWLPTDTQELFGKLVQDPNHRAYFAEQGWLEPGAISYKINSEGFRCEEFAVDEPCMIALGCSYTVGIGLPIDVIWPTLVGRELGLKVYNLAWGGNSTDTCFRLARYWIPKLKPSVVAMLAPPRSRIEVSTIPGTVLPVEIFMPMSQSMLFRESDEYLKHWFSNEKNHFDNQEKNMLAIESIAVQNSAKFTAIKVDNEAACCRDQFDYARDYMHTGPTAHKLLADTILRQLL